MHGLFLKPVIRKVLLNFKKLITEVRREQTLCQQTNARSKLEIKTVESTLFYCLYF